MVLSSEVRMTENIRERKAEVFEAIRKGVECRYLYCITMPSCDKNLLDIHPYRELYKRNEYDSPFIILGLSEHRKGAVDIVTAMVSEVAASMERPEEFKEAFVRFRDSFLISEESLDER